MVFSLLLLKARSSLCTEQGEAIHASYFVVCHRRFIDIRGF